MPSQTQQFETALQGLTPEERQRYVTANPTVNVGGQTYTFGDSAQTGRLPDIPVDTSLSADEIGAAKAINITQPKPSTEGKALLGELETGAIQTDVGLQRADTTKAKQDELKLSADLKNQARKEYLDLASGTKGATELKDEAYVETGADTYEKELKQSNLNLFKEQNALRKQVEEMRKTWTGSKEGFNDAVDAIERKSLSKQADLAIVQMTIQGQFDSAKSVADRKVAVQLERDRNKLEAAEFNYQEYKDEFTKAEQRQFESARDKEKRRLDKEETSAKTLSDVRLELLRIARGQNAPASILTAIQSSTTPEDAIIAAGQYSSSPDNEIRQLENGETVVIDKNTGKIVSTVGGAKTKQTPSYAGLSPEQANDPFVKKMLDSAGGKPLTDTFAQKLDKGLTVLGQIGSLQTNIKDVKTGPIAGLFKGANPWDTNAQTIKAQLNAIVPNLARGVYGEVGVLTDNDIAQYSKTLPNLKSTEDIRNAVLGITVDLIGKSVKRTLEVNAANGKDVSGFVDLYTEMENTKNNIFAQIPGYNGVQTPETAKTTIRTYVEKNTQYAEPIAQLFDAGLAPDKVFEYIKLHPELYGNIQ